MEINSKPQEARGVLSLIDRWKAAAVLLSNKKNLSRGLDMIPEHGVTPNNHVG